MSADLCLAADDFEGRARQHRHKGGEVLALELQDLPQRQRDPANNNRSAPTRCQRKRRGQQQPQRCQPPIATAGSNDGTWAHHSPRELAVLEATDEDVLGLAALDALRELVQHKGAHSRGVHCRPQPPVEGEGALLHRDAPHRLQCVAIDARFSLAAAAAATLGARAPKPASTCRGAPDADGEQLEGVDDGGDGAVGQGTNQVGDKAQAAAL
eukprot:scaffold6691_cov358-Prasinococcus_capsulatus_cf.AAC.7